MTDEVQEPRIAGMSDANASNLEEIFEAMEKEYNEGQTIVEQAPPEESAEPEAEVEAKPEEPAAEEEKEGEPEEESILASVAKRYKEAEQPADEAAILRAEVERLKTQREEELREQLRDLQEQLKSREIRPKDEGEDDTFNYTDPAIVAQFERLQEEGPEALAEGIGRLVDHVTQQRLKRSLKPLEEKLTLQETEATRRQAAEQLTKDLGYALTSVYQDSSGDGTVERTARELIGDFHKRRFDSILGHYIYPTEYRKGGPQYGQVPPALQTSQTAIDAIRSVAYAFAQTHSQQTGSGVTASAASGPSVPEDAGIASSASTRSQALTNPKPELTPEEQEAEELVGALLKRRAGSAQLPADIWK